MLLSHLLTLLLSTVVLTFLPSRLLTYIHLTFSDVHRLRLLLRAVHTDLPAHRGQYTSKYGCVIEWRTSCSARDTSLLTYLSPYAHRGSRRLLTLTLILTLS